MLNLSHVLLAPIVSEKMMRSNAEENSVGFWVNPKANKQEIKLAVERFFKVDVLKVTTSRLGQEPVRFGGRPGVKKARKKAYVKLASGQEITSLTDEG